MKIIDIVACFSLFNLEGSYTFCVLDSRKIPGKSREILLKLHQLVEIGLRRQIYFNLDVPCKQTYWLGWLVCIHSMRFAFATLCTGTHYWRVVVVVHPDAQMISRRADAQIDQQARKKWLCFLIQKNIRLHDYSRFGVILLRQIFTGWHVGATVFTLWLNVTRHNHLLGFSFRCRINAGNFGIYAEPAVVMGSTGFFDLVIVLS